MVSFALSGLAAILLTGFLFAWSGLYNVAASRGHWAVTDALLTFGMRNSVKTHSFGIKNPPLDDRNLLALGAAHFHSGCAYCHGAPALPASPTAQGMLPPPPDLSTSMREWNERELFWIIKNGIKYTGMPAWASQQRDDEVWALVAFVRMLPRLDARAYRELALGGLIAPAQGGGEIAAEGASEAVSACARCHGENRRGPTSHLVPILHGQPAAFLLAALEDYAHARRPSGIMQPQANDLSSEDRAQVAHYYAALPPPVASEQQPPDPEAVERGRHLATKGDPGARLPPCMDCHSASSLNVYPRLAGQHSAYMSNRLRLWKGGLASHTTTGRIMVPIARSLSEQQIEDVSTYFASLTPGKQDR